MNQELWNLIEEASKKVVNQLLPDQILFFDPVWEYIQIQIPHWSEKPFCEWPVAGAGKDYLGEQGFAEKMALHLKLGAVIGAVCAILIKPLEAKLESEDFQTHVEAVFARLEALNFSIQDLQTLRAQLEGPIQTLIVRQRQRRYYYETDETNDFELKTEADLLESRDCREWNLWLRKYEQRIEVRWRGRVLQLEPMLAEFLFALAIDRGRAKSYEELSDLLHKEEGREYWNRLKGKLLTEIKNQSPELAARIPAARDGQYEINLNDLSYCIAELQQEHPSNR